MTDRRRRLRAPLATLAALALVALGPGAASADGPTRPVDDVVKQVQDGLGSVTEPLQEQASGGAMDKDASTAARSSAPPAPAPTAGNDDDSPGHETVNPKAPDHAGSEVAGAELAGEDVAQVGSDEATVEDDDSTKADSTLLALGGQEVGGAHADSAGADEAHFGDPLAPLCTGSEGALCVRLLYSDAYATENGRTSHARSQSGVASICLGGDGADPEADCAGPVRAGVATSESEIDRNQVTGRTTARSHSDVADVCLAAEGECAVEASVLESQGSSDSGSSPGTASRSSSVLGLSLAGNEAVNVTDPQALAVPPDCTTPSLVCVFANQGETYLGDGIAGHAQEALHASVLGGVLPDAVPLLDVRLANTESLVHNDGGEPVVRGGAGDAGAGAGLGGAGGPGMPGAGGGDALAGAGGVLPNTGGFWSGLIAVALFSIGGGAFFIAFSRRRMLEGA